MFRLEIPTHELEEESERRDVAPGVVLAERLRGVALWAESSLRILPVDGQPWITETYTPVPDVTVTIVSR